MFSPHRWGFDAVPLVLSTRWGQNALLHLLGKPSRTSSSWDTGLGTSSQRLGAFHWHNRNKRAGKVCAKGYVSASYKNANAVLGLLRVFGDAQ